MPLARCEVDDSTIRSDYVGIMLDVEVGTGATQSGARGDGGIVGLGTRRLEAEKALRST